MDTSSKAVVTAALIAAIGGIVVALITNNSKNVDPDSSQSCPDIPPVTLTRPAPKQGYIWVQEEWNWKDGKFVQTAGHWERVSVNPKPVAGYWDKSGGKCTWVSSFIGYESGKIEIRDNRK